MGSPVTAALIGQADGRVGTGHLRECLAVAGALCERGGRAQLWTSAGAPAAFFAERRGLRRLGSLAPAALASWARRAARGGARVLLVNLWNPSIAQTRGLRAAGLPVIVMDEVGGKNLDADYIVNPLLLPGNARYPGSRARVLAGPSWLALDSSYRRVACRTPRGPVRRVLVTFGGADRTGATPRAARILGSWRPEARKLLVLGPAFRHEGELAEVMRRFPRSGLEIVRGARGLARLIASCDAVLTAGGNTLCEAACLGVPALVAHEDPHERRHGRAFATAGFARGLGPGRALTASVLTEALEELDDPALRRRRAAAGRRFVDGRGAERLAKLIEEAAS
jgi:spore coat polysaccharide biosynthesis predicted glycosyltransferase SpsG